MAPMWLRTAFPTGPTGNVSANPAELTPLEHASGVLASSGPFPVTWAALRANGTTAAAEVEGRDIGRSLVDEPKLTDGTWVRSGGVVIERGFATGLGVRVGDRITLAGHSFEVVGIAVTAAVPNYTRLCVFGCDGPSGNPGFVWLTEADATRVSHWASQPIMYFLNLKLKDPATAEAFANAHDSTSPTGATLFTWQQIRDADSKIVVNAQLVLLTGSWLLGLLAIASVAVLVGGRMAEESRRVGLLKAVGGTPSFVATVLLVENLLLALCAAAIGLVAGWLAAPLVDGPGAGLLGTPGVPPVTGTTIGLVVAVAVAVAFLATLVPAIRAARTSTVRLLDDAARVPRRRAWMIAPSRHLPVSLLIAARLAARRPRRLLLNVFSVAITDEWDRRRAGRPCHRQQQRARVFCSGRSRHRSAASGDDGALGDARPSRLGERCLHRLGDRARCEALIGAHACTGRDTPTGDNGVGGRADVAGVHWSDSWHPRRHRDLCRREEWG